MSEVQETAAEPAIVKALLRLPPSEQHRLLEWSQGLGAIRYGTLRGGKKVVAMFALTRDKQAAWPLVKLMARAFKHIVWDARSWKFRLGLGTVIATFVAIGNAATDTVALGGGIGLPLWVMIGAGGAVVGLLADKIETRMRKRRRG